MVTEALQPGHRPVVSDKVAATRRRLPQEPQLKFMYSGITHASQIVDIQDADLKPTCENQLEGLLVSAASRAANAAQTEQFHHTQI